MLYSSLKFSAFLVLSQFVLHSQQQCLGTSKMRGIDYTFALAQVSNNSNPLGPQEACYFNCGAQIVTQSSNRGDMARLTLMDNAATVLTSSGFLLAGQTYYLNHLGLEENEGGNGIGCIQVLPGNRITHYPRAHQICQKANVAICGFWGKQSIPVDPRPKPSISSTPATTNRSPPLRIDTTLTVMTTSVSPSSISPTTSDTSITTRAGSPIPTQNPPSDTTPTTPAPSQTITTTGDTPSSSSSSSPPPPPPSSVTTTEAATPFIQEILPEIETISDLAPFIDEKLPTEQQPSSTDILHRFNVEGRNYHVVNKNGNSLAQATMSCRKSQTNIGGVTSAGYQAVTRNLQYVVDMTGNKLIIGSWNGDNYSLRGNTCLIMQLNNGIYSGDCAEATAVLCQS
ncbi:H(+)-transporting V1 sector ATPase subunit D [Mucor velutinosus]|uniref:H(+)-transporting V1 sector ATPase subunit D n=1 Tax=Mucor velutinosus TaxID=708070 RepID=A0AAN7D913_9FUNG|nr:H(+)-transporting V1 sector ATPase subunit D [Mucor velutinosus]